IKTQPESVALNYELGDTLLRGQDAAPKAIPFLEKAAQISPDDMAVRASLGRAYMRVGEPEKAIPQFKAALGLDEEGTLYYQLATASPLTPRGWHAGSADAFAFPKLFLAKLFASDLPLPPLGPAIAF